MSLCFAVSCSDTGLTIQTVELAPYRFADFSRHDAGSPDSGILDGGGRDCACDRRVVDAGHVCLCERDLAHELEAMNPGATWATLLVPQGDRAVFGRSSREIDSGIALESVRAGRWGLRFGEIDWFPEDQRVRVGEVSNEDGVICGGTPLPSGSLEPTAWLPDGGLWRMPNVEANCRTMGGEIWAAGNIGNWLATRDEVPNRIPGSLAARIIGVEADFAVIADTRIVSGQTHFIGFTYSADAGTRELRGAGDPFGVSPVAVARGGAMIGLSIISPQSHRPVLWRAQDGAPTPLSIPSGASDVEAHYVSRDLGVCGTSSRGAVFWLGPEHRPVLAEELGRNGKRCVGAAPDGRFVVIDPTVSPVKTLLISINFTD